MSRLFAGSSNIMVQKASRMIDMMLADGDDMIDEALALMFPLFADAELSVLVDGKILSSTVLNTDNREAIELELSFINKVESTMTFDSASYVRFRPGIKKVVVSPIKVGLKNKCFFVVEFYSKMASFDEDKYGFVLKLFSLLVKQYHLNHQSNIALRLDSVTMLPMREALIDSLRDCGKKSNRECCLAILSLSNAAELNRTYGMSVVDEILKGIGVELHNMLKDRVYRIGGTKFAIILYGDIYSVVPDLECVVDRVLDLDKRIVTSTVVAPVSDEPYKSIFVCESNLKHCTEDTVTIVRNEYDIDDTVEIQDVVVVSDSVVEDSVMEEDVVMVEDSPIQETLPPEEYKDTRENEPMVVEIDDSDIPEEAFSQEENNPSYVKSQNIQTLDSYGEHSSEKEYERNSDEFTDFMTDFDFGFQKSFSQWNGEKEVDSGVHAESGNKKDDKGGSYPR